MVPPPSSSGSASAIAPAAPTCSSAGPRSPPASAACPTWVALPSAVGTVSLITALLGMYWDISLHIDQGRDPGPLANPAHYLILFGLFGIFAAGFLSMAIPKEKPCPTAIRLYSGWYAPLGGFLMTAAGGFALIGFPLDDVWHRLFGQDVTLWGPTHLMLIGGASVSLIGQGVLLAEGARARAAARRPPARARAAEAAPRGARRRLPDRPLDVPGRVRLRRAAVRLPLPADADRARREHRARLRAPVGRPRRALGAVAFFLIVRGFVSLMVHGVWGQSLPHFPLYLVEALLVEASAATLLKRGPLTFGAIAGLLIGTVGTAAEWAWSHVWMPLPWPSALLPEVALVTVLAGVAGGLVGTFIGMALRVRPEPFPHGARVVYPLAGLAVAGLIAFGLSTSPIHGVNARCSCYEVHGQRRRHVSADVDGSIRRRRPTTPSG